MLVSLLLWSIQITHKWGTSEENVLLGNVSAKKEEPFTKTEIGQNETKDLISLQPLDIQGVFFNWYPPKKLKYGKPRLGESTAT